MATKQSSSAESTDTSASAPAVIASAEVAVATPNALMDFDPEALAVITDNISSEPLHAADLDRIKVPAGGATTWEVPALDGVRESKAIRGVILVNSPGRSYWAKEYGDDESTPPDCMSLDSRIGVGTPGGDCELCPMNQFESAAKGKGKACKETRTLLFLLDGDLLPTVIRVPPSGLKAWRGYMMRLSKGGLRMQEAVTELTLNKTKSSGGVAYAEIVFRMDGRLSDMERGAIGQLSKAIQNCVPAPAPQAQAITSAPASQENNPFADNAEAEPKSAQEQ